MSGGLDCKARVDGRGPKAEAGGLHQVFIGSGSGRGFRQRSYLDSFGTKSKLAGCEVGSPMAAPASSANQ